MMKLTSGVIMDFAFTNHGSVMGLMTVRMRVMRHTVVSNI